MSAIIQRTGEDMPADERIKKRLFEAVIKRYEAKAMTAMANLETFMMSMQGVADHTCYVDEISKLIEEVERASTMIEMARKVQSDVVTLGS